VTTQLHQLQGRNPGEARLPTTNAHEAKCCFARHGFLEQLLGSLLAKATCEIAHQDKQDGEGEQTIRLGRM